MARKLLKPIRTKADDSTVLKEVIAHYNDWTEDNEQRRTRKGGWNDITDAYWGKLPTDWPYISKVVDPVIRTTIIEKNARLMNSKLRGRLVPREGGDMLSARLNNALLDFQWENANYGGTMLEKWAMTDQDTRLYASKFGLVLWRYEKNDKGEVIFCGNEYYPLDIRDCGMSTNCDHIRNAKWFQHRQWKNIDDYKLVSEVDGKPIYPGFAELERKMAEGRSDRRDNAYENRVLSNKGLTDRVGDDKAFPVIEEVTEYRKGRWITFSPRYKVILRNIENPYAHGKIPVVQNRYYALQGDPIGESEVEPVLPLWRAIQAVVCGFLDEMNIRLRPPLKIIDGKARIETIVMGPEAQWIMDQVDAVTEHQSSGNAMQTFQTTYSALKSAFSTAMGDLSQGVSQVDPFTNDKTATEIKRTEKQQNTRDQKNQTSLAEAIQDMMSMWLSNNKQFLFADPDKKEYILRIVGTEMFNYFQKAGLDEMDVPDDSMLAIGDIVSNQEGNVSDEDITSMLDAAKMPKHPVFENPDEEDPTQLIAKPKMIINETGDGAEISLVPEDLNGNYDYIADTKSMSAGADAELQQGISRAIDRLIGNPTVLQLLQMQGVQPQVKELLVAELEGGGLKDAERFFTSQQPGVPTAGGGLEQAQQVGGIPPELEAIIGGGNPGAMAQPQGLPQPGQVPGGVQPGVQQSPGIPSAPQAF